MRSRAAHGCAWAAALLPALAGAATATAEGGAAAGPTPRAPSLEASTPPRVDRPGPRTDAEDRRADAHADRVILVPTAYTHPAGTITVTSYDVILLQLAVAASDVTQISFTATPPLGEDSLALMDLSLKTAVVREPRVRLAAMVSASGGVNAEAGQLFLGRVGGVTQLCLEARCRSSASVGSTLVLGGPALLVATGIGLVWRVSGGVALLAELDTLLPLTRHVGEANGLAGGFGVRFPGSSWALDLALVGSQQLVPALPLVALTYRSGG